MEYLRGELDPFAIVFQPPFLTPSRELEKSRMIHWSFESEIAPDEALA